MATTNARAGGRVAKSMEMYERLLELIPGGTQLISRRPTRFALGVSPVVATRGKGSRIWDVDGNVLERWPIRHAHGRGVDAHGDIYLGLTIDQSVDKYIRQR